MVEQMMKLITRAIREHSFTNECTYEHSLYEHYSDNFKRLATAQTVGYREIDLNQLFTRSTMQFGSPFTEYTPASFGWHLSDYYGAFTSFHQNEAGQEH